MNYEKYADEFILYRESRAIGLSTVLTWAALLPAGCSILDLGCGSGKPLALGLAQQGFQIYGIDASPSLLDACQRHIPSAKLRCKEVQSLNWFDQEFDAVMAVGLIFLLPEEQQVSLIHQVVRALKVSGQFLLSAPTQVHQWRDLLTGAQAVSLGRARYLQIADEAGFKLSHERVDEGDNHYYGFLRTAHRDHV